MCGATMAMRTMARVLIAFARFLFQGHHPLWVDD
jgi:hypothetical protein